MKLHLLNRKTELPGVETFRFQPDEPIAWKAGQFLHYVLHHEPTDDRGSDRWFTIASAPFEKEIQITTRLTAEKGSTFKNTLAALKVGDEIEISLVDGDFVIEDPAQELVFIAGGIGVTPFHSILKEADHAGTKLHVTLLYANRDTNIVFQEEFNAFQKNNPSLTIYYVIAPEHVDEALIKNTITDLQKPIFYVSGPEQMVDALSNTLKTMGVPENHIKGDWFPGYPVE